MPFPSATCRTVAERIWKIVLTRVFCSDKTIRLKEGIVGTSPGRTCGRLPWLPKEPFYWTRGTPSPLSGHVPSARIAQSDPNSQWSVASGSSKNAWHVPNRIPDWLPQTIILLPTKSTLDGTSPCSFRWLVTLCTAPLVEWGDKQDAKSPHQQSLSAA